MARPPMSKPYVIGLTGGIGMGKSETAKLFAEEGVSVHDADAAISRLYGKGGAAVEAIAKAFPGTVKDGAVDRAQLAARVVADPGALARLEQLVHPLVQQDRKDFLEHAGASIVLFDIPLLFEIGAEREMDAVVVASAPEEVRRARVLARPGMTADKFESLKARQLDDAKKRQQAHYVVMTDKGLDHAREQVRMILAEIRKKISDA
jgi:dephospho-CoA kinase